MKRYTIMMLAACAAAIATGCFANPVFDGWYADPQMRRYGDTYWVFPTTSARFAIQTSFDAFSSRDMKTWTKHSQILTTNEVKWAKGAKLEVENVANVKVLPIPIPIPNWKMATLELAILATLATLSSRSRLPTGIRSRECMRMRLWLLAMRGRKDSSRLCMQRV